MLLSVFWILSLSCANNDPEELIITPGIYKGQFIRSSPYSKYSPSNVSIEFTSEKFSGVSDREKIPAICSGTYSIKGKEINFKNECFFTADFDWTLILNGDYQIQCHNHHLVISRTQNEITDTYSITLQ